MIGLGSGLWGVCDTVDDGSSPRCALLVARGDDYAFRRMPQVSLQKVGLESGVGVGNGVEAGGHRGRGGDPGSPVSTLGRGLATRCRGWAYDTWFRAVHQNRLVYNTCWEDPRIDRSLLGLDRASRVVMITSAGCNALEYLLDDPAEIHAVDVNPRQNALLELKQAMLCRGDFGDLFQAFGRGFHPDFGRILAQCRELLSVEAFQFWTLKKHYLDGENLKRSFYFHGSSGDVAWILRTLVLRNGTEVRECVEELLGAGSLADQKAAYERLEPLLWGGFTRWLVRQPMTLSLLGVPRPQARLLQEQYPGGILGFVQDKLRQVVTEVAMADNYFWRVYVMGEYTEASCPEYLRAEHFQTLRDRCARVRTHSMFLSQFLSRHPGTYSHYVLLDHQDWLAWQDPEALHEEWRLILRNSRSGTRVLFRSAALQVDFLPGFIRERVQFKPERTEALHRRDRVGTYGSLHLAEVL